MRDAGNIRDVEALGIDMMGFIFYPRSPRYAEVLPEYMPRCRRVGVFVNADAADISATASRWGLWGVQLHGAESAATCRALCDAGLHVVKAFGVGKGLPSNLDEYSGCCDMYLFDTACASHGGSGRCFDWGVLSDYHGDTPFLLSGGIGPDSLQQLQRFSHRQWAGIDLNSAFELSPGFKDAPLIGRFLRELHRSEGMFTNVQV